MIIRNLDRPTNFLSILRLSLIVLILPLASRAETPPLVVSEPILVPATKGRFDCLRVDEQFHRLLANHTGNGTLDVFDLPDGKLRQTVPIGAAQDVAIDNERGKYYVTVSDRSELTIVDRQTLKVVDSVALPGAPDVCASGVDQIAFDPANNRIYCASGRSGLSVVEQTADGVRLIGNITTPPGAHTLAVDPATHAVWIAYAKENESFLCKLSVPP